MVPNFRTALLFAEFLLLAVHFSNVLGAIDYCFSDPRLKITQYNCSTVSTTTKTKNTLIYVPEIDDNPIHAIADTLWAVTYFVKNCFKDNERATLAIPMKELPFNECTQSNSSVLWKDCALTAIISSLPNVNTAYRDSDECFDRRVQMDVAPTVDKEVGIHLPVFRGMSWFGRLCLGTDGPDSELCGYEFDDELKTELIPLPDEYKEDTLRFMRSSFHSFLGIPDARASKKTGINVLVYDRSDTDTRKWLNANETVADIQKDTSLSINVKYLNETPLSFADQAAVYNWADIVVAPHGGAMVNANFFMHNGTDILEIWPNCKYSTAIQRFVPQEWTGWFAIYLQQRLTYIQCHPVDKPYRMEAELDQRVPAPVRQDSFKVRPEEISEFLEYAVIRQRFRLDHLDAANIVNGGHYKWKLLQRMYDVESELVVLIVVTLLVLLAVPWRNVCVARRKPHSPNQIKAIR